MPTDIIEQARVWLEEYRLYDHKDPTLALAAYLIEQLVDLATTDPDDDTSLDEWQEWRA